MPTGRMYHPAHAARASVAGPVDDRPHDPTRGRRRRFGVRRVSVVAACAVAMLGLVPAAQADPQPVTAEPTIAEVATQVDALYVEMSAAVETYNQANVASGESRARLETLQSNLARIQADFDAAAEQAGLIVAAQYRSAGSAPALQMLMSDDATDFLGRMSALDQIADRQAQTIDTLDGARDRLEEQQRAVERETARLDTLAATLETAMGEAEAKHASAQELLERLTAEERARVAAEQVARAAAAADAAERAAEDTAAEATDEAADDSDSDSGDEGEPAPPPPIDPGPLSGRAAVAVDFGLAQVGDAYVWGAAGPDAWDCSGLTSGAWGAAGVSLPHSSGAQAGMGTAVSSDQLQPGDLVFYYSPISHVAMYIGNGQVVQAANPSKPVNIASVFSMPIASARRVG